MRSHAPKKREKREKRRAVAASALLLAYPASRALAADIQVYPNVTAISLRNKLDLTATLTLGR